MKTKKGKKQTKYYSIANVTRDEIKHDEDDDASGMSWENSTFLVHLFIFWGSFVSSYLMIMMMSWMIVKIEEEREEGWFKCK